MTYTQIQLSLDLKEKNYQQMRTIQLLVLMMEILQVTTIGELDIFLKTELMKT